MALTDILTTFGQSPVLDFNRGNVGTVLDALSRTNEFVTPRIESGGGGETSHVF